MSDAKDMFHNWAGNMTDTKFVTWQKHGAVSDSKDVIAKWDKRKDKNKTYRWCVEEKASGQAILRKANFDPVQLLKEANLI